MTRLPKPLSALTLALSVTGGANSSPVGVSTVNVTGKLPLVRASILMGTSVNDSGCSSCTRSPSGNSSFDELMCTRTVSGVSLLL